MYIFFVLFFCLLLHRLAVRISLPFHIFLLPYFTLHCTSRAKGEISRTRIPLARPIKKIITGVRSRLIGSCRCLLRKPRGQALCKVLNYRIPNYDGCCEHSEFTISSRLKRASITRAEHANSVGPFISVISCCAPHPMWTRDLRNFGYPYQDAFLKPRNCVWIYSNRKAIEHISASNIRAGVETRPPQWQNLLYFFPAVPSLTFYGRPHPCFARFCDTRISVLVTFTVLLNACQGKTTKLQSRGLATDL